MLITLYTPVGIVYQKFIINETDITYGDLIKYINLPKNELYDEIDFSKTIYDRVFIKTIITLFNYEKFKEISLDDQINGDINEFGIMFSYEYYIYCNNNYYDSKYKKIENNIKNGNNDAIENDPYQIIFIDCDCQNYEYICKSVVKKTGLTLQCIKPELMTDEICKLAVRQNGIALKYVPPELMTDEICKLAVQQNGNVLYYVKPELITEEICKLAVQQCWYVLKDIKDQTDEICKLAINSNSSALIYIKEQTDEICKLAVQKNGNSLKFVRKQTKEICKLAIQQDQNALCHVKKNLEHQNY